MLCPNCNRKAMRFRVLLITLNPFRATCIHCASKLKAGASAYVWTALHMPLGIALAWLSPRPFRYGELASRPPRYLAYFRAGLVLHGFRHSLVARKVQTHS